MSIISVPVSAHQRDREDPEDRADHHGRDQPPERDHQITSETSKKAAVSRRPWVHIMTILDNEITRKHEELLFPLALRKRFHFPQSQ